MMLMMRELMMLMMRERCLSVWGVDVLFTHSLVYIADPPVMFVHWFYSYSTPPFPPPSSFLPPSSLPPSSLLSLSSFLLPPPSPCSSLPARPLLSPQKQLQDYTAWVNNYLKRKPGTPLVTDLRANLQDGLTFVNLVEIVGKEELYTGSQYE